MHRTMRLLRRAAGLLAAGAARPRARHEEPDEIGTPYHVSPSGDDRNSGTTVDRAWRTLEHANAHRFGPGDQLLLEGGREFAGPLCLGADSASTPERPIVIGSYGSGRATIRARAGSGIVIRNLGAFRLTDLDVVGDGRGTDVEAGIAVENGLPDDVKLAWIRIDQVEVSGFLGGGITVRGLVGKSGYRDVLIERVTAHANGRHGVDVHGVYDHSSRGYANENVVLRFVVAHSNSGIQGPDLGHTGSGIVIQDVNHGLVEHSAAFNNGWLSDSRVGGPVGIWVHDSNDVTIQHNESHGNRTAGGWDGGGFDLDGGVTDCVVQHNTSHDNDGAGYLLAQYEWARAFSGNLVRNNVSRGDGRKNGYGAIHVSGGVRETVVHDNAIDLGPAATGRPAAIVVGPGVGDGLRVRHNVVRTAPGVPCVRVPSPMPGLELLGNRYESGGGPLIIEWGSAAYSSVDAFRAATGQERLARIDLAPRPRHDVGRPGDAERDAASALGAAPPDVEVARARGRA